MICEVILKFGKGDEHFLSRSNTLLNEIGRACELKDRLLLLEAYNKAAIYPAKNKQTFDSHLLDPSSNKGAVEASYVPDDVFLPDESSREDLIKL